MVLFLDGVGLGDEDSDTNPFARAYVPNLQELLGGQRLLRDMGRLDTEWANLVPTDATLGLSGVPQSATGQTTLITGVNAAQAIGQHLGPWPSPALHEIIGRDNLFQTVTRRGGQATLVNAYSHNFFEALDRGGRSLSAVQYAVRAAGLPFLTYHDLVAGNALSADFTNEAWHNHLGYADVPILSPEEAGATLSRIAQKHDLTFYDFWLTDLLGHSGEMRPAVEALERFDRFLGGLLTTLDFDETLLVVTSDHGNLEDLNARNHTRNPVPTLLVGRGRRWVADRLVDLADIAPALGRVLDASP